MNVAKVRLVHRCCEQEEKEIGGITALKLASPVAIAARESSRVSSCGSHSEGPIRACCNRFPIRTPKAIDSCENERPSVRINSQTNKDSGHQWVKS